MGLSHIILNHIYKTQKRYSLNRFFSFLTSEAHHINTRMCVIRIVMWVGRNIKKEDRPKCESCKGQECNIYGYRSIIYIIRRKDTVTKCIRKGEGQLFSKEGLKIRGVQLLALNERISREDRAEICPP